MKNVVEILTELGFELDENKAKQVDEAVRENYKTRAEFDQKMAKFAESQKRIEELEGEIAQRDEAIQGMNGNAEELEAYKQKVAEYQKRDEERKAKELEEQRVESFKKIFVSSVGDRKFANPVIEQAIFEKVYKDCTETAGKSCQDAIEAVTKDLDGVWSNPQTDPNKMPVPNAGDDKTVEAIKLKRFF